MPLKKEKYCGMTLMLHFAKTFRGRSNVLKGSSILFPFPKKDDIGLWLNFL